MASFYSLRVAYPKLLLSSMELMHDSNATLLLLRVFRGNSVRKYSDLYYYIGSFKYLHGLLDCNPSDVGLTLASASTRGQSTPLFRRRPINAVAANRFSHRAATMWNNLPFDCLKNNSLNILKKTVLYQLYKQQSEK